MFDLLAQATAPAAEPSGFARLMQYAPIILFVVLLYFMMLAPKRKQDKQRQELLNSLKKGDRVQTIGGVLGTVVSVDADEVLLKVDESSNTKMRFTRNAVHRVISDAAAADKK